MDEQMRNKLHMEIMNIPYLDQTGMGTREILAYKAGHRDARHAAAELVTAAQGDSSHPAGGECGGVPQWQSIETAPKNGAEFFATGYDFGDPKSARHYAVATWEFGRFIESGNGGDSETELMHLTHWMPAPAFQEATP